MVLGMEQKSIVSSCQPAQAQRALEYAYNNVEQAATYLMEGGESTAPCVLCRFGPATKTQSASGWVSCFFPKKKLYYSDYDAQSPQFLAMQLLH